MDVNAPTTTLIQGDIPFHRVHFGLFLLRLAYALSTPVMRWWSRLPAIVARPQDAFPLVTQVGEELLQN
jgi:hypothetical protein